MKVDKVMIIKRVLSHILLTLVFVTIGMLYVAFRVKTVTITYLGKDYKVKTLANTVKGVIKDKKIFCDDTFIIAPSVDSYIRKGQNILITKDIQVSKLELDTTDINNIKIVKIEEKKEIINYEVEEKTNDKLLKGKRNIIQQGKNGEKLTVYKTIYADNTEVKKSVMSETHTEPIKEIVEVGTKVEIQTTTSSPVNAYNNDLNVLAKVIYAEARGEPYLGQIAVGAVIVNRVKSSKFPNSISGVVYAPGQFCTVRDGQINLTPSKQAYNAAQEALNGNDPSNGALYFYNPRTSTSSWIFTRPVLASIGNHNFSK